MITIQLFCTFVFAYAKSRFSYDAAHFASFNIEILVVGKASLRGKTCLDGAPLISTDLPRPLSNNLWIIPSQKVDWDRVSFSIRNY